MRILILTNHSGGLYSFRRELMSALIDRGHTVYASVPDNGQLDELKALGVRLVITPVDRRGKNLLKDIKLYRTYRRIIRETKPELILTYTVKPNVYGGSAARRAGVPYAVNVTGLGTAFQKKGMLRSLVTVMYRIGLRKAGTVFFENQESREIFTNAGIVRPSQSVVLHGAGVNLEWYACTPYPKDSEVIRFLFIGRVMREKGVDELFSCTERLRNEGYACELHVLGGCEEDYHPRIRQGEAAGWLHYHGHQNDVRPFIANCHCAVLPSWHEGMANVNLEAASMGRPLITSRIHGCMEAVVEGESGLLCQRQNEDSLYEAMKTFMSLSHEERRAMGLAGRAHMEEIFDKKKVVAATLTALGI